jgi:hypothetical protein
VEELNGSGPGPVLYGFSKTPPVDNVTTWSETRNVSVQTDSHQVSFPSQIVHLYFLFLFFFVFYLYTSNFVVCS